MLCCKWWMQLLFVYVVPKGIWSFPGTWPFFSGLSFFGHDAHFFPVFRETFVPKKTTTNMNLPIICKACWAWMMWQGIIYGWLHLNWICSPFTSFLPFYVPPCFQGLDLIQPTSSLGKKILHSISSSGDRVWWCRSWAWSTWSSSGIALPILHLYCIGQGTKVTVVVTALPVYDPLKWLRMEIGRYLGWHSGDTRV